MLEKERKGSKDETGKVKDARKGYEGEGKGKGLKRERMQEGKTKDALKEGRLVKEGKELEGER